MSSVKIKEKQRKRKMDRQYLVFLKESIDIKDLKEVISSFLGITNIKMISSDIMSFSTDDILKSTISKNIHTLSNDLNASLLFLVSPVDVPFSEYVLKKMSSFHSEGVYSLSQGIIELLMKNDEFIKTHLFSWFSGLDYTSAITGKNYVESGFSMAKSCTMLSIHRNTMEYRLKKIKEQFNLDLRCFDDGILFLTYLSLSGICA